MVQLLQQGRAAVFESLDERELPQRAGAVERLFGKLAAEVEELAFTARRRHRDDAYVRANIDPNERYVPSPPGTAPLRPKAWESGAVNLALASDWIFTGINIGSFEGAVMSGLLAAHALTGAPSLHDIAGYDFGRPHSWSADTSEAR